MTFATKACLLCIPALLAAGLTFRSHVNALESRNAALTQALQRAAQDRNRFAWLLDSQEQTLQVFSTIRAANRAARTDDERLRHETQNRITSAVLSEPCADRAVPAAAVNGLHQLENHARAAGGTAPEN